MDLRSWPALPLFRRTAQRPYPAYLACLPALRFAPTKALLRGPAHAVLFRRDLSRPSGVSTSRDRGGGIRRLPAIFLLGPLRAVGSRPHHRGAERRVELGP